MELMTLSYLSPCFHLCDEKSTFITSFSKNFFNMVRHSKIQKQVLSLYRQFLRVTKEHPSLNDYVKNEFRKNATLPRTDVIKVEYLLRRGWRQLEMLKSSSVSGAGVFEKEVPKEKE